MGYTTFFAFLYFVHPSFATAATWSVDEQKTMISLGGLEHHERGKKHDTSHLTSVNALPVDPLGTWYQPAEIVHLDDISSEPSPRLNFIFEGPIALAEQYMLNFENDTYEEQTFFAFGGQHPYTAQLATNDVYILHLFNKNNDDIIYKYGWSKPDVAGIKPGKRMFAGGAILEGTLYVFGGYDNTREVHVCGMCPYLDDLHILSHENNTLHWTQPFTYRDPVSDERPSGRYQHSLDAVGSDKLVMFGGSRYNYAEATSFQGDIEYLNELWVLEVSNELRWKRIQFGQSDPQPPPRGGHGSAVHESKLYIYGGHSIDRSDERHPIVYDDLWVLNSDANGYSWQLMNPGGISPSARSQHSFEVLKSSSKFFSLGGMIHLNADSDDTFAVVDDALNCISLS